MEKSTQTQAGAPRRRRRRRGSGSGSIQTAASQQENKNRDTARTPASAGREKGGRTAGNQNARENKETPSGNRRRHAPQSESVEQPPQRRNRGGAQPAAPKETGHPQKQSQRIPRSQRRPVEEEPGLELITRRPPKQKFSNFEEYLAAHGGMTVPLPDEPFPVNEPVDSAAAPQTENGAET